jgi:hypothetical protein
MFLLNKKVSGMTLEQNLEGKELAMQREQGVERPRLCT